MERDDHRYEQLPGWDTAARVVVEMKWAPRHAVAGAGAHIVSSPIERADTAVVYQQALLWMRNAPLSVRIAAERRDVKEQMEMDDQPGPPEWTAETFLGPLLGYERLSPLHDERARFRDAKMDENEQCLGVFSNTPDNAPARGDAFDGILVTDRGVHVRRREGWELVSYGSILSATSRADNETTGEITVGLADGRSTVIRIVAGTENGRSLEQIARFLARTSRWVRAVG